MCIQEYRLIPTIQHVNDDDAALQSGFGARLQTSLHNIKSLGLGDVRLLRRCSLAVSYVPLVQQFRGIVLSFSWSSLRWLAPWSEPTPLPCQSTVERNVRSVVQKDSDIEPNVASKSTIVSQMSSGATQTVLDRVQRVGQCIIIRGRKESDNICAKWVHNRQFVFVLKNGRGIEQAVSQQKTVC